MKAADLLVCVGIGIFLERKVLKGRGLRVPRELLEAGLEEIADEPKKVHRSRRRERPEQLPEADSVKVVSFEVEHPEEERPAQKRLPPKRRKREAAA